MDRFENIGPFKVRIIKPESHHYSLENPNPDWEKFGLDWLKFAEEEMGEKQYKVPHIPHTYIGIFPENHTFYRSPQDKEGNFVLGRFVKKGVKEKIFRLYADYQHPSGPLGGGKANVDLSPVDDAEVILDLLKIAEKIFPPGELD